MTTYYAGLRDAGEEVLSLIAESFGAPKDFFNEMIGPNQVSTLRIMQFPIMENPPKEAYDGDRGEEGQWGGI